jgi:uncharacterized protein (DUF305 family)
MSNRPATALLSLALIIPLAACGSTAKSTANGATPQATAPEATVNVPGGSSATDATFNPADVAFAQGMIPHHEQAVVMSTLALDPARSAGPKVKDLATRIQAAQGPEIQTMTGWLTAWKQPLVMAGMEGMEGMEGMAMNGMMSAEEMTALSAATGDGFDKMWLEMMVRHHEGAVTMSKTEQTSGKSPEAVALAAQIVTAQEAEITEMKALLK